MFFRLFFVSVLLFGCERGGIVLHERNINDFIPLPQEKNEIDETYVDFSFAETHYPNNCLWHNVARVIDGDTIEIENNEKVRFIGIDTPESKDERKPIQRGALSATYALLKHIQEGDKVCLITDPESDEFDAYQRRLAYVFTDSGIDLNAFLIENGFARGLFYFPFSRRNEFEVYLQRAKQNQKGLWGDSL